MEDIKNKDSDEDEDLETLRLAALATLKSHKKPNDQKLVSYPSVINSIVTAPAPINLDDTETCPTSFGYNYNNVYMRRNLNQPMKRWERNPKFSRRSNLIVISPVGDEETDQSDASKKNLSNEPEKKLSAAKLLPQFRWCGSGNDDSMSPKTLRKTGPTRFNRHGSDSESSSEYDEDDSGSDNDSGSNETVLQDEPPEHFTHLSTEREGENVSDGVEKQRRLSFQSLDSEIQPEKSDTISVYNCLKNTSSSYNRSDSYTSAQNQDNAVVVWNPPAQNNYTTYNNYNNESYSTEPLVSMHSGNKHSNNGDNIQNYIPDWQETGNSYYTHGHTSSSVASRKNSDVKHFSYSDQADGVFNKDILHPKKVQYKQTPTLSRDDLRLELKKRLQEFGSKSTEASSDPVQAFIDDNLRHCAEGKLQNNILSGDKTNENSGSFENRKRYERSFSRERLKDEHSSRKHEHSLSRERDRSMSRDRSMNEHSSVHYRHRYETSRKEFRQEYASHHCRDRYERSSSRERSRRDHSSSDEGSSSSRDRSSSREKKRHNQSTNRIKRMYDRCSSRDRVKSEKCISSVETKSKHNAFEDSTKLDHKTVENIATIDHTQDKRLKIKSKNDEKSWSDRSVSRERAYDKRSLSQDRQSGINKNHERSWSDRSLSKDRFIDNQSLNQDKHSQSVSKNRERSWSRSLSKERLFDKQHSNLSRNLQSTSKNKERSWSDRSISKERIHETESSGHNRPHEKLSQNKIKYDNTFQNKRVDYVFSPAVKTTSLIPDRGESCGSKYNKQQDPVLSPQKKKDLKQSSDKTQIHSLSPDDHRSHYGKRRDHSSSPGRKRDRSSSYDRKHRSSSHARKSKRSKHRKQDESPSKNKITDKTTPIQKNINKECTSKQKHVIDMFSPDDVTKESPMPVVKKSKVEHLIKIPAVGVKSSDVSEEIKQERRKERFQPSISEKNKHPQQGLRDNSRKNRNQSPMQRNRSSRFKTRNKRSYSRSRSNSSSSSHSSSSSRNSKPKVQSVSSVIKPVILKNSDAKSKPTLTVTKPLGKVSLTDLGSVYSTRLDSGYSKITIKTERLDNDQKNNLQSEASKRMPVHMRLGAFPRKRVIQVNKDVEAAFINTSSGSDSETVSSKRRREDSHVSSDISGDKDIFTPEKNQQKSSEKVRRLKSYR